jgi:preprotein translocase subunit SecF
MEMIKNNKVVVAVVAVLLAGVTAFLVSKSSDEKVEEKADTAAEAEVVAPVDPAAAPAVETAPVDPAAVPAAEVKPVDGGEVVITAPAAAPAAEKK